MLKVTQVVDEGSQGIRKLLGKPIENVVLCTKKEDGWQMLIEILERKAIPDSADMLAGYVIHLDATGVILDFKRSYVRRRGGAVQDIDE